MNIEVGGRSAHLIIMPLVIDNGKRVRTYLRGLIAIIILLILLLLIIIYLFILMFVFIYLLECFGRTKKPSRSEFRKKQFVSNTNMRNACNKVEQELSIIRNRNKLHRKTYRM
jgi:hypothetical protein